MMNRHEVRLAVPDDEQGIIGLFDEVFPQAPSEAAWRWKTMHNPAGPALIGVASRGGRITGHLCFNRAAFMIGSEVCNGAQVVDMVTSDRYRGTLARGRVMLGISRLLIDEVRRQRYASFLYGFAMPHLVSFSLHVIREGDVVCRIPQLVRLCNPAYILRRTLGRYPWMLNPLRRAGRRFSRLYGNGGRMNVSGHIKQVTAFDHRFDTLWDTVAPGFEISVIRDRRYLQWRYPPSLYTVFCDDEGSAVHGFIVIRITEWNGWRVGCVPDILADSISSARFLIRTALAYLHSKSVDIIRCWMMEHAPYHSTFRRMGFASRPSPYSLVVRSHSSALAQQYLQDASNWYLTWGDSDGV